MVRRGLLIRGSLGTLLLLLILILYNMDWPETTDPDPEVMNWEESGRLMDPARLIREEDPNDPRRRLTQKFVHLDLKGMPPLVSYYAQLFPLLKRIGVTGLLVEYEDMFPFHGPLAGVANRRAYTKKEVRRINQLAAASDLEVIPLIQSFGHLEYVLKTEEFMELREVPRYPQVLCPSNNKSLELVMLIIDQVLALHPDAKTLHIGSDEVYFMGMCSLCTARMSRFSIDNPKFQLFLDHARSVAQHVVSKHGKRVLMWDDEFRQIEESLIVKSGIGQLVDIVVWNYNEDVDRRLGSELWEKYQRIFGSSRQIFIGSAFKGAALPNAMVVNETHYLLNHLAWIKTMKENAASVNFAGWILTGWQRYDHFAVLCELFAVAIPSLVTCMTYLNTTKQLGVGEIFGAASTFLGCGLPLRYCDFPGSRVHEEVNGLYKCQLELEHLKASHVFLGWSNAYQLRRRFSNPSLIESILPGMSRLKSELGHRRPSLERSLLEIYPDWSVEEWMETNYSPISREVDELYISLIETLEQRTFPVRPLLNNTT